MADRGWCVECSNCGRDTGSPIDVTYTYSAGRHVEMTQLCDGCVTAMRAALIRRQYDRGRRAP